jgi:hypothetical protein
MMLKLWAKPAHITTSVPIRSQRGETIHGKMKQITRRRIKTVNLQAKDDRRVFGFAACNSITNLF